MQAPLLRDSHFHTLNVVFPVGLTLKGFTLISYTERHVSLRRILSLLPRNTKIALVFIQAMFFEPHLEP